MKAAQNLVKFVLPSLNEDQKKKILATIVFDQFHGDMVNILNGQKLEKY